MPPEKICGRFILLQNFGKSPSLAQRKFPQIERVGQESAGNFTSWWKSRIINGSGCCQLPIPFWERWKSWFEILPGDGFIDCSNKRYGQPWTDRNSEKTWSLRQTCWTRFQFQSRRMYRNCGIQPHQNWLRFFVGTDFLLKFKATQVTSKINLT